MVQEQTFHRRHQPDAAGLNGSQALPQIFDANDKWNDLRADRVGDEFWYVHHQRKRKRIPAHQRNRCNKASFILSLNFPQAMDMEDPSDARFVSLGDVTLN
jgi:hypothetical protein